MKRLLNYKVAVGKIKTKTLLITAILGLAISGLAGAFPALVEAVTCTPTGFYRDGINMTAAVVNPTSQVTGNIEAGTCNIGVYFGPGTHGLVNGATISGANYYGIVVQKAKVNVENTNLNTFGESPLNGSQHGVGIY